MVWETLVGSSAGGIGVAGRPKISGCLIVRDEEAFLEECLARLWNAVDEVVVVDTGSTDASVAIAQRMGARVYHHAWNDDFAEARNFALSHATHPWIFVIDADEYVDEATLTHLRELTNPRADGYLIEVVNFPDDDEQQTISHHLAIFRNDPRHRYVGAIHEAISPSIVRAGGSVGYLPIKVLHYGYDPSIRSRKRKRERNQTIILRELRKRPNDPMLNYYLAQEYSVAGEWEGAIKYYRRALWTVGSNPARFVPIAATRLIIALWRLSRWEEAYEVLQEYQPKYVDYTDLHYMDGVLSRSLGNYKRAEVALLKAVALGDADPSKFELVQAGVGSYKAWTQLGGLYAELGLSKDAFAAWSSALKCNERYHPAVGQLARLALRYDPAGDVLEYLSRIADLGYEPCARAAWGAFYAARAWSQCDALSSQLRGKERALRTALLAIGRGAVSEAKEDLARLLQDEDTREHALVGVAVLAAETGDARLLSPILDSSTGGFDPVRGTLRDLLTLMEANNAAPLIRHVGEATCIETAWNLVERAVELGLTTALDRLGDLLKAFGVSRAQRALRFGKILEQHGFLEAATEQYLRAGLDGVYDTGSLLRISKHAFATGQKVEAVALLEKVVQNAAVGPIPYLLLARTLQELGDIARAEAVLEAGLQHHPYAMLLTEARRTLSAHKGSQG